MVPPAPWITVGISISNMIQSMYNGTINMIIAGLTPEACVVVLTAIYAITPFFAAVASGVGYIYGCKKPIRQKA